MMRLAFACTGLALGLAGCANLWGFQSVTTERDGGAAAASTEIDATDPSDDGASASDAVPDAADPPAQDDDAQPCGGSGMQSDASTGSSDAAARRPCPASCAGCCDTNGQCQSGRTLNACGGAGLACVDCSGTICSLLYGPCCGGANGCGCQLLSLALVQCQ